MWRTHWEQQRNFKANPNPSQKGRKKKLGLLGYMLASSPSFPHWLPRISVPKLDVHVLLFTIFGLVGLLIAEGQNSGDLVRLAGQVTNTYLKFQTKTNEGRPTTRVVCLKYQKTPFSLPKSAVSAELLRVLCFVAAVGLLCFEIRFGDVFFFFRCGSKQSPAPLSSSSSSLLLPFPLANNAFSVVRHERSALEDAPVFLGFLCSLVVCFRALTPPIPRFLP
jgi:hypothetical protein